MWSIHDEGNEDCDEVVKRLDENVDERKNKATNWDKMWQRAPWLYPRVEETHHLDTPAGSVRVRAGSKEHVPQNLSAWTRNLQTVSDPVSSVYALVVKTE